MSGRLAFRIEGAQWNAYATPVGTMKGAIFLGSVPVASIKRSPEIKNRFIELMKLVVEEGTGGKVSGWVDRGGVPESEQSGNA